MKYHSNSSFPPNREGLQVVEAADTRHDEPREDGDGEADIGKEDGEETSVNTITEDQLE